MCAPWVGKTDNGIYDVTICQATKHYVATHSAIHIACLAYISQAIKQNKYL